MSSESPQFSRRDAAKGLIALGISGGALSAGVGASRAQTITVTHYTDGLPGAPYVVAWEERLFEKHGFKLASIQTSAGGGTTIRNLMASDFPYGQVSLSSALEARKAAIDLIVIHSCTSTLADFSLVTLPESPIKEPKDLIGKRISYTNPASLTHMTLLLTLDKMGISADQVTLQAAGGIGAQLTALRSGRIDVATMPEPFNTRERGKIVEVFPVPKYVTEHVQADVGVVRPDFGRAHRKELQSIIAARREAIHLMYEDPVHAAGLVNKVYKQDINVIEECMKKFKDFRYWDEGPLDLSAMDRSAAAMRKVGIDLGDFKGWDGIVDTSFLPS